MTVCKITNKFNPSQFWILEKAPDSKTIHMLQKNNFKVKEFIKITTEEELKTQLGMLDGFSEDDEDWEMTPEEWESEKQAIMTSMFPDLEGDELNEATQDFADSFDD